MILQFELNLSKSKLLKLLICRKSQLSTTSRSIRNCFIDCKTIVILKKKTRQIRFRARIRIKKTNQILKNSTNSTKLKFISSNKTTRMQNLKKNFTKKTTMSIIDIFRKISFITSRFYSTIQMKMIMSFILFRQKSFSILKCFVANVKTIFNSITNFINISKTSVLIRALFKTSSSIRRIFLL